MRRRVDALGVGVGAAYKGPLKASLKGPLQTGEGFLLKFELCLGLSWLTLPCLVLGSACALVFACARLGLACPWLCFCFFCLCFCWNMARQ